MPISFIPYTAVYGPLSLPGTTCQLWLDGADPLGNNSVPANGATVSTWVDKSRNGRNATGGVSPTYNTSQKAIVFNGSSWLTTSYSSVPTNETIFIVYQTTSSAVGANCFMIGPSDFLLGGRLILTVNENDGFGLSFKIGSYGVANGSRLTMAQNQMYIGTTTVASTTSYVYLNGTQGPSSTLTYSGTGTTQIGTAASGSAIYIGYIYEIVIYNTNLTTPQQQSIEGYLAQKWGLTSQLPPGHQGLKQTLYNGKVYQPQISLKPAPYANYFPLSLAGCALWLDAADPAGTGTPPANGSTVSTWKDKSGNNVILNTVGTPTYNSTQYGKGGVIFNGSSYFQNTTFSFPLATRAIFIVANGSSGNTGILAMTYTAVDYSSLNSLVYVTSGNKVITLTEYYPAGFNVSFTSPVEPVITSDSANGTTVSYFGNGTLVQSLTFTPTTSTGIIIGARNDAGGIWVNKLLTGNINEIILYKTTLTTNQRQQVEGYLAWKWGIQSSFISHPYSSAPPVQYTRGAILPPPTLNAFGRLPPIVATGGTITFSGAFKIHTFTTVGTTNFVVRAINDGVSVQVLVVGGGGGGGVNCAGGGGAGGAIFVTSQTVTSGSYSILVGAGGGGGINPFAPIYGAAGSNGGNSTCLGYTGIGGGGGGWSPQSGTSSSVTNGLAGGCGGGGAGGGPGPGGSGGTPLQAGGFTGGTGVNNNTAAGGGGGMGSAGSNGSGNIAGSGGNGATYTIGGTAYTLAGGGGGGAASGSTTSSGGSGGGGAGAQVTNTSGSNATYYGSGGGGGAGGGEPPKGGDGFQGIVIIAYNYL